MSEVEAVREGHQSEVLLSIADEFPAHLCLTLVFRGRQGNLDLVAESPEEAQAWIRGVRKLIHKAETMDEKERLDQYPSTLQQILLLGYHILWCTACFFQVLAAVKHWLIPRNMLPKCMAERPKHSIKAYDL